jgi:hypothetical protein
MAVVHHLHHRSSPPDGGSQGNGPSSNQSAIEGSERPLPTSFTTTGDSFRVAEGGKSRQLPESEMKLGAAGDSDPAVRSVESVSGRVQHQIDAGSVDRNPASRQKDNERLAVALSDNTKVGDDHRKPDNKPVVVASVEQQRPPVDVASTLSKAMMSASTGTCGQSQHPPIVIASKNTPSPMTVALTSSAAVTENDRLRKLIAMRRDSFNRPDSPMFHRLIELPQDSVILRNRRLRQERQEGLKRRARSATSLATAAESSASSDSEAENSCQRRMQRSRRSMAAADTGRHTLRHRRRIHRRKCRSASDMTDSTTSDSDDKLSPSRSSSSKSSGRSEIDDWSDVDNSR